MEREAVSFDLEQLATWFVAFGNLERMAEGLIGEGAENGTVDLIARKLHDVTFAVPRRGEDPSVEQIRELRDVLHALDHKDHDVVVAPCTPSQCT